MSITIEPYNLDVITIAKINIKYVIVTLYEKACINYDLIDSKNNVVDSKLYYLTSDEYALWSYDDGYPTNLLLQRLGLIRTS